MPQLQVYLPDDSKINLDLNEERITVGRLADNTLAIDDGSVSSNHAEIILEAGEFHLHDLGSTNGTFVNGEQVTDAILRHGDEVRFGQISAVYAGDEAGGDTPLPVSVAVTSEAATSSGRPANFRSSSPAPRTVKTKDPAALAVFALAGLGVIAFVASLASVFAIAVGN